MYVTCALMLEGRFSVNTLAIKYGADDFLAAETAFGKVGGRKQRHPKMGVANKSVKAMGKIPCRVPMVISAGVSD